MTHVDEKVNTKIIKTIAEHFGEIIATRWGKQKFLVMDIEFLGNGKVLLFMKDYIGELTALFNEDLDATVSPSAKKGLQNIN